MDPSFFVWLEKHDATGEIPSEERHMVCVGHLLLVLAQSFTKRFSAIAAMPINGIEDVNFYEENVDTQVLSSYIEQTILPLLQLFNGSNPQSILIIVTASIHHLEGVIHLIHQKGCLVWFLTAHSPELNTIEEVFSKVKAFAKTNEASCFIQVCCST